MNYAVTIPRISNLAFQKICRYVVEHYGINLTEAKRNLVENRLHRRIKQLDLISFEEYTDHLFSSQGRLELGMLCDYLSTNKTYFYREPAHFTFLEELITAIPTNQSLQIWSAACSGGDEVYTITSILEEKRKQKPFNYQVLGTDISSKMIREANEGIYDEARISPLPLYLKRQYFKQLADETGKARYEASEAIRKQVSFKKFNLIKDMASVTVKYDIIFCRNVLIYFKEETKKQVVNDLVKALKPNGYLILGHCEGMICRDTELKQIRPSIFQKPAK